MTAPVQEPEAMPGVAGSALVVQRGGLRVLCPVAAPAELIETQNRVRAFIVEVLKDGRDYGTIPGTTGKSMLKPGAEKVTAGFGCVAVPRILEQEVDHFREVPWRKRKKEWVPEDGRRVQVWIEEDGVSLGLYRYVVAVDIVDQDGTVRGTGLGSCCSMESKYCDRPRDVENTVLKMARKRAHVAAVLDAFGLSDEFNDLAEDEAEEAGEPGSAPANAKARGAEQGLFPIPFGPLKNRAVADVTTKELQGALEWNVKTCPEKFVPFQKEAKAELERRATKAEETLKANPAPQAEPTPTAQPALGFDAPPGEPPVDELPF